MCTLSGPSYVLGARDIGREKEMNKEVTVPKVHMLSHLLSDVDRLLNFSVLSFHIYKLIS